MILNRLFKILLMSIVVFFVIFMAIQTSFDVFSMLITIIISLFIVYFVLKYHNDHNYDYGHILVFSIFLIISTAKFFDLIERKLNDYQKEISVYQLLKEKSQLKKPSSERAEL